MWLRVCFKSKQNEKMSKFKAPSQEKTKTKTEYNFHAKKKRSSKFRNEKIFDPIQLIGGCDEHLFRHIIKVYCIVSSYLEWFVWRRWLGNFSLSFSLQRNVGKFVLECEQSKFVGSRETYGHQNMWNFSIVIFIFLLGKMKHLRW